MLPESIKPMLAQSAHPFDSDDYLLEVKWDGIRAIIFIERGRVRIQSRELLDLTAQFPEFAAFNRLPAGTVLDGEIIVLKDGAPSLSHALRRLQVAAEHRRQELARTMPAVFVAFDLLYVNGECLMSRSCWDRRERLGALLASTSLSGLNFSDSFPGSGSQLFAAVCKLRLEGIVAKHKDSPYLAGKRSRHWLKIKGPEYRRSVPETRTSVVLPCSRPL